MSTHFKGPVSSEKGFSGNGTIPPGGTTGQVLTKNSNDDFDVSFNSVSGSGDVVGPGSAVDGDIVLFDGTTGKLIKDSGIKPADKQDAFSDQPANEVFAGPTSGPSAAPAFRALTPADIPSLQYSGESWIQCNSGDDSTGDGSFQRPWKTLAYACTQVAGNHLLHLTGFYPYDQSAGAISLPANVFLVADYPGFQISQPITITGGGGNDQVIFQNITLFSTLTWNRNDGGNLQLWLLDSEIDDLITFKQAGAGQSGSYLYSRDSVIGFGFDVQIGQVSMFDGGLYSTTTYEDSGTCYLNLFHVDIAAQISINGGVIASFAGCNIEAGTTLSATMTGSGTPSITTDSGSVPGSISGTFTTQLNSYSKYTSYTPTTPSDWNVTPSNVQQALDELAQRCRTGGI